MKQLDFYCNFIIYNSINRILMLYNRSISCTIFYDFSLSNEKIDFRITYNTLKKTKDKNIFRIINQKVLFRYDY